MSTLYYESSISHHGIKGQKWGVRRFQNPDGTLTKAGKVHQMNKEASQERGRKIAADKTKHFGSDAAKVAGVNVGAFMAKNTLSDLHDSLVHKVRVLPYISDWDTPAGELYKAKSIEASMNLGIEALYDMSSYVTAGQVIYSAVKGVKMAKDIVDYHNYKKTKMS